MSDALRARLEALGDAFWLRPAILVLLGVLLGEAAVRAERGGWVRSAIPEGWLYEGGEAGARALLGAVGSSTIGVAGTVFSITVAALSMASAQMGPRLLRNFVRDGGNQAALGIFLGTFAYALVVLRTVRTTEEGPSCRISASPARSSSRCSASGRSSGSSTTWPRGSTSRR